MKRIRFSGSSALLTAVMILGFALLAISSGGAVIREQGLVSLLVYLCVPILTGLSQMAVLAIGQLNLAIGAMGGVCCGLMAVLMASLNVPVWLALLLGLLTATALGAINGILVVLTQLHGFIVTLATMTILTGVQYALVASYTIDAYPDALKDFSQKNILGVPYVFMITLLVSYGVSLFFKRAVRGREILATGGAEHAAMLSGISTKTSMIWAYTVSGALTGAAAVISMTTLTGVNKSIGGDWLLPSFAAPVIGGVLMTGGAVAIYGTIIASSILRLVDMARAQFLLDPSWTNFVIGAVVLLTVTVNTVRERGVEAGRLMKGAKA